MTKYSTLSNVPWCWQTKQIRLHSRFFLLFGVDQMPNASPAIRQCTVYRIKYSHDIVVFCIDVRNYIAVFRESQWRHNGHDGVSNHQPHDCLLKRLFRRRSKKTSKLRVTGLCVGNSPVTGEFPAQRASNAENVSILMTLSCHRYMWHQSVLWHNKPQ